MNRNDAFGLAKIHAIRSPQEYTKVENFQPHEWVLNAILDAYNKGGEKGHELAVNSELAKDVAVRQTLVAQNAEGLKGVELDRELRRTEVESMSAYRDTHLEFMRTQLALQERMTAAQETQARAAAPEALKQAQALVTEMGDAIVNMLEQLGKGNWKDDLGHEAKMNTAMLALPPIMYKAMDYRAKFMGYRPGMRASLEL